MPYRVRWEVDIEDDDAIQTPEQAAQKAVELFNDAEMNLHQFDVIDLDDDEEETIRVDLGE